jgi:hypothetical protein
MGALLTQVWVQTNSDLITDATAAGKGLLTAEDMAAQRTLLSVYSIAQVDGIISGLGALTAEDIDTLAEINAVLTDADLASISYVTGLIGVTVQAYDADTAKLDVAQTWPARQIPGSSAITFASSITDDLDANGLVRTLTLTGDVDTFAVSNGTNYQIRRYYVLQDGTGGHTITFSGIDGTEPVIDTDANALTVFEIEFVPGTGARFV